MNRHQDHNAEDHGPKEDDRAGGHPPAPPSASGQPTGEKQAAVNRDNDPPA
jgi:hypothetical protein